MNLSRLSSGIIILAAGMLSALLPGCAGFVSKENAPKPENFASSSAMQTLTTTPTATHTPQPTKTNTATPTPLPKTATATLSATPVISGPDSYPSGVNPLTGQMVTDPDSLLLPPALVSISNSPVTARPQAGLSFSPLIFELYIGEGATRFLTLFYGDLPKTEAGGTVEGQPYVGPIRSGRLPYETLRTIYNGYLIFAGASPRVIGGLDEFVIAQNPNPGDINGAIMPISDLQQMAAARQQRLGNPHFSGLLFDPAPPPDGKAAEMMWVSFSYTAQVFWRYDSQAAVYRRYQNTGEGTPLAQASDRLTGEALSLENVIVMFVNYHWYDEYFFNIDFLYVPRFPALLLRDGTLYEIYWTTRNQEPEWQSGKLRPIRFVDYEGNPIPLKPGQTWVELVQLHSSYYETVDSEDYYRLTHTWEKGSGNWAVTNYIPAFEASPTPES